MSERQRRFFTASTVERAVLEAASYLGVPASQVRYAEVRKRGLARGGVTIRIDRDAVEEEPVEVATPERDAVEPAGTVEAPEVTASQVTDDEDGAADAQSAASESPGGPSADDQDDQDEEDVQGGTEESGEEEAAADEPVVAAAEDGEEEEPEVVSASRAGGPRPGQRIELPSGPEGLSVGAGQEETEETASAARWVEAVLDLADLDTEARVEMRGEVVWIDLSGPDEDLLLEDSGQLLQSIQHLMPRLMQSDLGRVVTCVADSGGFREYHAERLRVQAVEAAEAVRRDGRAISLEPMNPPDRREVHIALAEDPAVDTESSGRGYFKRITVRPA
ncbi:MAG: hypothetical protein DWQ36_25115 [Acidobacteria bacterium]|nr:MAG: hypothetical protein DWQ30_11155 [Acidobacteriota bacterium]REJ99607.1 MAG: hypothetical protein DWQ36_25115 [Acidobacteriota bacterium]